MTISSSTPRIRITRAWYAIVLMLVGVSEREWGGMTTELAGLLLMMAAALGRIWTSAHIAGHKDTHLITFGPYSVCRHPLYAFSLLAIIGVGLVTRSMAITLGSVVILGGLHLLAIRAEERKLTVGHGDAFARYKARVPMLLPSWRHFEARTEATLNLPVFRKALLDAGTLVLMYVVIQLLDAGRQAQLWPTLIRLP